MTQKGLILGPSLTTPKIKGTKKPFNFHQKKESRKETGLFFLIKDLANQSERVILAPSRLLIASVTFLKSKPKARIACQR